MAYNHPIFPVFLVTFGAFILLVLITFSTPLISTFYFLHTSQAGGVRFGIWGWCLDEDGTCMSPLQLGYSWEPQIVGQMLKSLVFYPIAAIFSLFACLSLIPVLCNTNIETSGAFSVLALLSFVSSFIGFTFMIAIWSVAKFRFQRAGFDASFGPLPWMSLAATIALLVVAINSGYRTLWPKRKSTSHHAYRY